MTKRADKRRWRDAITLAELGELTAQWLQGDLRYLPGYDADAPDEETAPLIPTLAAVNRAGYVTNCSQPGYDGPGYRGHWRQRAAVEGFADDAMTDKLRSAAIDAGLWFVAARAQRQENDHLTITVTEWNGRPHTRFGGIRPIDDLRDGWVGYGECSRHAVEALCGAYQVAVVDPVWGRNDVLWAALDKASGRTSRPAAGPTEPSINGETYTLEDALRFWAEIVRLAKRLVGAAENVEACYRHLRLDPRALGHVHMLGEAVDHVRAIAQDALDDLRTRHGPIAEAMAATKASADEAFYRS